MPAEYVNKVEEDFYEFMVFMGIWNTFLSFFHLYPGVITHHNILCDVAIRQKILIHRIPTQPDVAHVLYSLK